MQSGHCKIIVLRIILHQTKMGKFLLLILASALIGLVEPHGYLKSPMARSGRSGNNQGVWCGNVVQDLAISNCGRCGEAPGGTEWSSR